MGINLTKKYNLKRSTLYGRDRVEEIAKIVAKKEFTGKYDDLPNDCKTDAYRKAQQLHAEEVKKYGGDFPAPNAFQKKHGLKFDKQKGYWK